MYPSQRSLLPLIYNFLTSNSKNIRELFCLFYGFLEAFATLKTIKIEAV
jgi:hypothetical protein